MKHRETDHKPEALIVEARDSRLPLLPVNQRAFGLFDEAKLKDFRERLRSLRYTEERVSKRLRVWHLSAMELTAFPIYADRLRQHSDALSTLISLFLLQSEAPREAADAALNSDVVDELLTCGLLIHSGTSAVAATVSIYPCCGFYFVTDHRFRRVFHDYHVAPVQPVMYLGQDSYSLAYLAPKPPKKSRVLDLCTGSGVQAILAARYASYVIGVDINPRAVEIARFNAALNGVSAQCDFRCGNLYEALSPGADGWNDERFDLILANPPFVPSPHTGSDRLLFQDAGPGGDEIIIPVLAGLLTHMKPRGMAAIISLFAEQTRVRCETRIKKAIGSQSPIDLLLLKFYSIESDEFASWFTWRPFGDDFATYSRRYKEWLDTLRSQQIVRLTHGVLVVRASKETSFRTVDVALPQRRQQNAIRRIRSEPNLRTQQG